MDKKLSIQLNGSRKVTGTLRGYDVCIYYWRSCIEIVVLTKKVFLNITLDEALEEQKNGDKLNIGTIVSSF